MEWAISIFPLEILMGENISQPISQSGSIISESISNVDLFGQKEIESPNELIQIEKWTMVEINQFLNYLSHTQHQMSGTEDIFIDILEMMKIYFSENKKKFDSKCFFGLEKETIEGIFNLYETKIEQKLQTNPSKTIPQPKKISANIQESKSRFIFFYNLLKKTKNFNKNWFVVEKKLRKNFVMISREKNKSEGSNMQSTYEKKIDAIKNEFFDFLFIENMFNNPYDIRNSEKLQDYELFYNYFERMSNPDDLIYLFVSDSLKMKQKKKIFEGFSLTYVLYDAIPVAFEKIEEQIPQKTEKDEKKKNKDDKDDKQGGWLSQHVYNCILENRQVFGEVHPAIIIGPWVFEWNIEDLVRITPYSTWIESKSIVFQHDFCRKLIFVENNDSFLREIREFVSPLIDLLINYNLQNYFCANNTFEDKKQKESSTETRFCNSFSFYNDIFSCLKKNYENDKTVVFYGLNEIHNSDGTLAGNVTASEDQRILIEGILDGLKKGFFRSQIVIKDTNLYQKLEEAIRNVSSLFVHNENINKNALKTLMDLIQNHNDSSNKNLDKPKNNNFIIPIPSHEFLDDLCFILKEGSFNIQNEENKALVNQAMVLDRFFWFRYFFFSKNQKRLTKSSMEKYCDHLYSPKMNQQDMNCVFNIPQTPISPVLTNYFIRK